MKIFLFCFVTVLCITGCTCTGGALCPNPAPKESESLHILTKNGLSPKSTKIYVDDSIDEAKHKAFIETFAQAINSHEVWQDVYISEENFIHQDKTFYQTSTSAFNNKVQDEVIPGYITKVAMDHYAFTGDFKYKKGLYNFAGLLKSAQKYPHKKYQAMVLDTKRLEITGFESDKEAIDLFLYLVDATIKFGFDEDFTKTIESVFQKQGFESLDPTKYYGGMAFELDQLALSKEHRLIIKSVFNYYSLKIPLQNALQEKVLIVDNAKEADVIVSTNNLAYISLGVAQKNNLEKIQTQNMAQLLKDSSLNNVGMSLHTLSSNTTGSAQARGAISAIAGAELAIGLIDVFSGPSKTQNRYDLQKVYYLKPNGEILASKIYANSTAFTEAMLPTYYFNTATYCNQQIAKQILDDLQ